jgi:hypothetical protein
VSTEKEPFKREFWRPGDVWLWVRKQPRWGWGWTINWAALVQRLRRRRRPD